MALDMNDLMAIRGIDRDNDRNWGYGGRGGYGYGCGYDRGYGMSPYEQMKVSHMASKRASGTAIAGLTLGTVGVAVGIGAWIFGGLYGSARSREACQIGIAAKEQASTQYQASVRLLEAEHNNTQRCIDRILHGFDTERAERIGGDQTITQTVTNTVSGQQSSLLTAQQSADLSAVNSVMNQTFSDAITGRSSLNPTPVSIYSAPQPCGCPGCCNNNGCGCGCNS